MHDSLRLFFCCSRAVTRAEVAVRDSILYATRHLWRVRWFRARSLEENFGRPAEESSLQYLSRSVVSDGSGSARTDSGSGRGRRRRKRRCLLLKRSRPRSRGPRDSIWGWDHSYGPELGYGRVVWSSGCPRLGFRYWRYLGGVRAIANAKARGYGSQATLLATDSYAPPIGYQFSRPVTLGGTVFELWWPPPPPAPQSDEEALFESEVRPDPCDSDFLQLSPSPAIRALAERRRRTRFGGGLEEV